MRSRDAGHARPKGGFTLIELTVAIGMSALVVAAVFGAWTYYSRHIVSQTRRSLLETEVGTVARSIVTQVRRARQILAYDENSIAFVAADRNDTVSYSFDTGELLRNGAPVVLAAQAARISRFDISAQESDGTRAGLFLTFVVSGRNTFGDSTQVTESASVAASARQGADTWNW